MFPVFQPGTYLGFTWSSDSSIGLAEFEAVITDDRLDFRMATGTSIHTDGMDAVHIKELSRQEIAEHFNDGTDVQTIRGVKLGESGVVMLLLAEPDEAAKQAIVNEGGLPGDINRIVVLGLPNDYGFDHSMLALPEQVAAGTHERNITNLEANFGKGVFPRLALDGKPTK